MSWCSRQMIWCCEKMKRTSFFASLKWHGGHLALGWQPLSLSNWSRRLRKRLGRKWTCPWSRLLCPNPRGAYLTSRILMRWWLDIFNCELFTQKPIQVGMTLLTYNSKHSISHTNLKSCWLPEELWHTRHIQFNHKMFWNKHKNTLCKDTVLK